MDKIKVTIKAKQVVEYYQEVEMTKEDYKILKNLDLDDISEDSNADRPMYRALERYIDYKDVFDCRHEFTDVQIEKVK